jgi:hypothetical protein
MAKIKVKSKSIIISAFGIPCNRILPSWQYVIVKTVYNKWGFKIAQYILYRYIVNIDTYPTEYKRDYVKVKIKRWWN